MKMSVYMEVDCLKWGHSTDFDFKHVFSRLQQNVHFPTDE